MTPNNAATIWTSGASIFLHLPGGNLGHTVALPNTDAGLRRALLLLNSRNEESKIGEPGDLTQHQIDKALAETNVKPNRVNRFTLSQRVSMKEILRQQGLI